VNTVETRIEDIRILITDDNAAIHDDFRRILATGAEDDANLAEAENLLFGDPAATPAHHPAYALDFALQGEQAVQCVKRARADGSCRADHLPSPLKGPEHGLGSPRRA